MVRTLKELDYVEKTETLLLGHTLGQAKTAHGELKVIGIGDTIRFTLAGHDGYVELNLNRFADAAIAWLAREQEPAPAPAA
jgi:hypothetical protein